MKNKALRFLGLTVLAGFYAFAFSLLSGCNSGETTSASAASVIATPPPALKKIEYQPAAPEIAEYRAKGLPMLLDFGRGWCKPCKAMAPDLDALHSELAGKVLVRFNDLGKETELAEQHKIRIMPTQVYLNGKGEEVFRHEGYASKADMTSKMKELGFL